MLVDLVDTKQKLKSDKLYIFNIGKNYITFFILVILKKFRF